LIVDVLDAGGMTQSGDPGARFELLLPAECPSRSAEWREPSIAGAQASGIKPHKAQLTSDRTSCRSALSNQVRLVLHIAAYWLMFAAGDAIPKARDLATAGVWDTLGL
jgi:hypothetical protein